MKTYLYITALITYDENEIPVTFTIKRTGMSHSKAYQECDDYAKTHDKKRSSLRFFEYGELLELYGIDIHNHCGKYNIEWEGSDYKFVPC